MLTDRALQELVNERHADYVAEARAEREQAEPALTHSAVHCTLYVGAELDKDGRELSAANVESALADFEERCARIVGGFTLTRTVGGWIDEGRLVQEHAFKFDLLCDNKVQATYLAELAKDYFCQKAVLMELREVQARFV